METTEKNRIYERLLAIKIHMAIQNTPNPRYIGEKLSECHRYIEEVENFMITVSQERSVLDMAYNNSFADYERKKEDLLTKNEEIKNLPNIKDREAKANSLLREESQTIREYKNELSDLNNLLKVISLKLKNLSRTNGDIRIQLRIMESQVKMGAGSDTSDMAMKSLAVEFNKSLINKDSFEDADSDLSEQNIVDPTEPLDIEGLFEEEVSDKLTEPLPDLGSDLSEVEGDLTNGVTEVAEVVDVVDAEERVETEINSSNVVDLDQIIGQKDETPAEESVSEIIDLDQEIGIGKEGETKPTPTEDEPQKEEVVVTKEEEAPPQKNELQKEKNEIDIEDLLENFA